MAALRRRDLGRVFFRSLWLQASWSFEGMQNLGFAYAMEPALERLHGAGEGACLARARHLEFFNTHPYLAGAILGCAVKLEEEGRSEGAESVSRAKEALMGAYGAVGDSFYWGGFKPLLSLAALAALAHGAAWAPWAFLALYALGNLGGRLYFFVQGYRRGMGIVDVVNRLNLILWSRRLKAVCAFVLGLVLAAVATGGLAGGRVPVAAAGAGLALTGTLAWLFGSGVDPLWAVYGATALAAVTVIWT